MDEMISIVPGKELFRKLIGKLDGKLDSTFYFDLLFYCVLDRLPASSGRTDQKNPLLHSLCQINGLSCVEVASSTLGKWSL